MQGGRRGPQALGDRVMPRSNWIMAGMTMTAAVAMGLGLGTYATSPQAQSPADEPVADAGVDFVAQDAVPYGAQDMRGPAEVKCSGCGPTLAERQWRADMVGWDPDGIGRDSADPVVRDYLADEPAEESAPPAPPSIQQLPANIVRFAGSDVAGRPVPESKVPGGDGSASPPPLVRRAAAAMP